MTFPEEFTSVAKKTQSQRLADERLRKPQNTIPEFLGTLGQPMVDTEWL